MPSAMTALTSFGGSPSGPTTSSGRRPHRSSWTRWTGSSRQGRVRAFAYERPSQLDEGIALLEQHGPDARPLAGGTDLIIRLRDGSLQPRIVVDVKRIAELDAGIAEQEEGLRIG